ncbi:MAG: TRAP transporter TatT component family protein [Candidatus Goldiibacteriota bacterium]|jgi:hypothetical protein
MKRAYLLLAMAAAALFFSGCSLKRTVINSTALFMDDVVDEFMAEPDAIFAEQAGPANLKLLDGLIKGSNYENESLLIKGCKLYGMYALAFFEDAATDKKQDKENLARASVFYKRAADYGMMALKKNNDFKSAADGSLDDFIKVMPAFNKSDEEALFWTAFAWGSYINLNRNSAADVANLPRVKAMVDRVIELDPSYFYGLPDLFLIVYYSMPKMFGGDTDKAKAAFDAAAALSGGKFVMTDFYTAKFYAVQTQDKALFEKLLDNINSAAPDAIPEELFTAVAKKKAAVLKAKEDDLF